MFINVTFGSKSSDFVPPRFPRVQPHSDSNIHTMERATCAVDPGPSVLDSRISNHDNSLRFSVPYRMNAYQTVMENPGLLYQYARTTDEDVRRGMFYLERRYVISDS